VFSCADAPPFADTGPGACALTRTAAQRGRVNRATTEVRFSHAAIGSIRLAVLEHVEDNVQDHIESHHKDPIDACRAPVSR
jgi:hypothetical protein